VTFFYKTQKREGRKPKADNTWERGVRNLKSELYLIEKLLLF